MKGAMADGDITQVAGTHCSGDGLKKRPAGAGEAPRWTALLWLSAASAQRLPAGVSGKSLGKCAVPAWWRLHCHSLLPSREMREGEGRVEAGKESARGEKKGGTK